MIKCLEADEEVRESPGVKLPWSHNLSAATLPSPLWANADSPVQKEKEKQGKWKGKKGKGKENTQRNINSFNNANQVSEIYGITSSDGGENKKVLQMVED